MNTTHAHRILPARLPGDHVACEWCPFTGCETCPHKGGETHMTPDGAHTRYDTKSGTAPSRSAGNTPTEGLTATQPLQHQEEPPAMANPSQPRHPTEHLDACPACLTRDNPPVATTPTDHHSIVCDYTCRRCGQDWTTSWWEA